MKATFTVYGEPFGKQSVKAYVRGGRVHTYSSKENIDYQTLVKLSYLDKYEGVYFGDNTQLKLTIIAYRSIPKSTSNKRRLLKEQKEIRPITRPDTDNISKAVCDSLNKLAFRDDSQITTLIVKKYYATIPRVEIEIELDKNAIQKITDNDLEMLRIKLDKLNKGE